MDNKNILKMDQDIRGIDCYNVMICDGQVLKKNILNVDHGPC
jgi:hypothetical protein